MHPHAINKLVFEFNCTSEAIAGNIQTAFIHYTAVQISKLISSVLTEHVPGSATITIDTIEIDLGNVFIQDFGLDEMLDQFKTAFTDIIARAQVSTPAGGASGSAKTNYLSASEADLEITRAVLLYGDVPWWVDKSSFTDMDTIFGNLMDNDPRAVRMLLETQRGNRDMWLRLATQYKPSTRTRLLALMPEVLPLSLDVIQPEGHYSTTDAFFFHTHFSAAKPARNALPADAVTSGHQTPDASEGESNAFHFPALPQGGMSKQPGGGQNRRQMTTGTSRTEAYDDKTGTFFYDALSPAGKSKLRSLLYQSNPVSQDSRKTGLAGRLLKRINHQWIAAVAPFGFFSAAELEAFAAFLNGADKTRGPAKERLTAILKHRTLPEIGLLYHHALQFFKPAMHAGREYLFNTGNDAEPVSDNRDTIPAATEDDPLHKDDLSKNAGFNVRNLTTSTFPAPEKAPEPGAAESRKQTHPIAISIDAPAAGNTNPALRSEVNHALQSPDAPETASAYLRNTAIAAPVNPFVQGMTRPEGVQNAVQDVNTTPGDQPDTGKQIALVMKALGSTNPALFFHLEQLHYTELAKLKKIFTTHTISKAHHKQVVNSLLQHPGLLRHNLLLVLADLSLPEKIPHVMVQNSPAGNPAKQKAAGLNKILSKIKLLQARYITSLKNLPVKDATILHDIICKQSIDSTSEKKLMIKTLTGFPADAVLLLQFFTELPETELKQLAFAGGRMSSAGNWPQPAPDLSGNNDDGTRKYYIANAGLCLVAPYLVHLFTHLGYLEKGVFRNRFMALRALYILQYMATGNRKGPEYLMQLNKLLCGFNMAEGIASGIRLTKKEVNEADTLISSVIENWKALKQTSVQGFRESFLQRNGILFQNGMSWTLQVEKKGHDILLNTIPWGYSLLKLPWMKKMIQVEW